LRYLNGKCGRLLLTAAGVQLVQIKCNTGFISQSAQYTCNALGLYELQEGQTEITACAPITCPALAGPAGSTSTCVADGMGLNDPVNVPFCYGKKVRFALLHLRRQ
jgi:hypothetical protein